MNLERFYEREIDVLGKAFEDLQMKQQLLEPIVGNPIVLDDDIVNEWLTFNYLCAVDFTQDNNPMMGEIGGVIASLFGGESVLAVADASMDKILYGFGRVKTTEERKHGPEIISEIEKKLEMPVESKNGVMVVKGTKNIAHYDFTTGVAYEDPLEMLVGTSSLVFGASGMTVICNKHLDGEQYFFHVPKNERLFHRLLQSRRRDGATYEDLLGVLRSSQETMRTDSITGIRIKYTDGRILTSPVIGQRELEASSIPRSRRTNCTKSDIKYIGGKK